MLHNIYISDYLAFNQLHKSVASLSLLQLYLKFHVTISRSLGRNKFCTAAAAHNLYEYFASKFAYHNCELCWAQPTTTCIPPSSLCSSLFPVAVFLFVCRFQSAADVDVSCSTLDAPLLAFIIGILLPCPPLSLSMSALVASVTQ